MAGPSSGTGAIIYDIVGQVSPSSEAEQYVLPPKIRNLDFIIQVDITVGKADVMIQGRLGDGGQWKNLMSAVVNEVSSLGIAGLQGFSWIPQVRVTTSNVLNTPDIKVEIFHG